MLASTETLKLFDTSLYPNSSSEAVAQDLAGLYIEAGDSPLDQRINPRKLQLRDDKVFDPETEKEVPGSLKRGTPLNNLEADSAESFYTHLRNGYSLVVAVSPPGGISPYKEGRVNVGYRKSYDEIEFYGIPTHLSPETLLAKSILLSEFSDISLQGIDSLDKLRGISIPILIPPDEVSPWDFLEEMFPLDSEAWERIKEGKPWPIKEKARKDALSITPNMVHMMRTARTQRDFLIIGAIGEREMERQGWKLNSRSCSGKSNSELLSTSPDGRSFTTDSFGNTRELSESSFPCPRCGAAIASGYGITTCPSCGLTKEQAGSTCA